MAVAAAAGVAVVAVVLASGGDGGGRKRVPLGPTTTRADLSGVMLGGVEGTTTSTALPEVGGVSFSGVVRTPDGRVVPGAVVRAEWGYPTDPPTVIDLVTDAEGRYSVEAVHGGRWRVRAWRTPDFATSEVADVFFADDEQRELDLEVQFVDEVAITWDIETDPPIIDHNAELVVVVVGRTVDVEGRVVTTPFADLPVTLSHDGAWVFVVGSETEETDAEGRVRWVIRCGEGGSHPLAVSTSVRRETLNVAGCIPITATTTTTTEPPDTTTSEA